MTHEKALPSLRHGSPNVSSGHDSIKASVTEAIAPFPIKSNIIIKIIKKENKTMKKTTKLTALVLALVLTLALALTGCGSRPG